MSAIASMIRLIEFISTFGRIGLFCPLLDGESNNYTKEDEVQRGTHRDLPVLILEKPRYQVFVFPTTTEGPENPSKCEGHDLNNIETS